MDTPSNSASPPANADSSAGNKGHTRTYQACGPCRDRKVKCDMGPVDNPHPPPCARCRRESKTCVFSTTRRKRKNKGDPDLEDGEGSEYDTQNNDKRARTATVESSFFNQDDIISPRPRTPGGSLGSFKPLRRPTQAPPDPEAEERSFDALKRSEVFGGTDGLATLIDAAANLDARGHHSRAASFTGSRPSIAVIRNGSGSQAEFSNTHGLGLHGQDIKPFGISTLNSAMGPGQQSDDAAFEKTVRVWNRLRFVRAGLFTAREGMAYIDYFYKNLYPLTPMSIPNYRDLAGQIILLEQEHMLLITILTITSRHMRLEGHGGQWSRPAYIHEKLWTYLRTMVERVVWAQEQFGGGFCGAGLEATRRIDPFSQHGMRTIGTVESFILMTEWNPRALHFPPGDDDDKLLVPEDPQGLMEVDEENTLLLNGTGDQRRDSWLEPVWRSDRMCWMLTNCALTLAFEIGIFEEISDEDFLHANPSLPHGKIKTFFARKNKLKELLWVYFVQTSGRLELIGKLPRGYLDSFHQPQADKRVQAEVARRMQRRQMDPDQAFSPMAHLKQYAQDPQGVTLFFWQEIAAIMKSGNQAMFLNRDLTRDIIRSGRYADFLHVYQPLLRDWRNEFERCTMISEPMRYILSIEYEYSRIYLHSLALQAIIERCVNNTPSKRNAQLMLHTAGGAASETSSIKSNGGAIPPAVVRKWMGIDGPFIAEVIDGCRNVLETVINGLSKGKYLMHCPVRTYFRIISCASFLLKTLALGDYAGEVQRSIRLLRDVAGAMRNCIVDDVHVGNRFAEACDTVTDRISSRFVRMGTAQGPATAAASRAQSQSPVIAGSPIIGPPNGIQISNTSHPNQANMPWGNNYHNGMQQITADGQFLMNASGRATPNNNYAPEFYDINTMEMSIMPPPNYLPNGQYDNNFTNGTNAASGLNSMPSVPEDGGYGTPSMGQDWWAVPLDNLINHHGTDVNATTFGPDVGGFDMLDILLPPGTEVDPMIANGRQQRQQQHL